MEETVVLETADGFHIAATLYRPGAPRPPGLILVHRLGADRNSWAAFATRARTRGYMAIAVDLRGHGESRMQDGKALAPERFTPEAWRAATADLRAAKEALISAGADPDNLAAIGESIGANLVLNYAAEDPQIQGVVLLSPGIDYKGVETEAAIAKIPRRPVLIMAADGDAYAATSSAKLKIAAPGFSDLHVYGGTAHGTDLFAIADEPMEQVFTWLGMIISPEKREPETP